MANNFATQLKRTANVEWRKCFIESVKDVEVLIVDHPKIPDDIGNLKDGIRRTGISPIGVIKEAKFESTTTNQGTDYPSILENVQVIQPKAGNPTGFLHFMHSSGGWVKTKQINNKHYRWWSTAWDADSGQSLWIQALRKNFK